MNGTTPKITAAVGAAFYSYIVMSNDAFTLAG